MTIYRADSDFARALDSSDPLASVRNLFHIPKSTEGKDLIYLCGNSLGLQPKAVADAVLQELDDWRNLGVEGHFHARHPWLPYHEFLTAQMANLVGAKPIEVVAMNGLTVNLHLMMVSFYRPTARRHRIVIESQAFPSDRYAVASQLRFHGFDPATSLLEWEPRPGENILHTEDLEQLLGQHGDEIALILIGGVNYYTGQFFDVERITMAGQARGCVVGWDFAHAVGNVPLQLHEWGVDFACWCSYKYLNSGPGSVAGCFVHERHANNSDLRRFCGWWGHDKTTRFAMGPEYHAIAGAEGWQLSNPPILALAAVKASLDIFVNIGMTALREKSLRLTGYLEFLLDRLSSWIFTIMTPRNPSERGCQLSLIMKVHGRQIFEGLTQNGVICDWREPDCVRIAPVPLYNSFVDVHEFVTIFAALLARLEPQAKVDLK